MQLTARENAVLTTIVEIFITTAKPVGSRTVAKASALSLSPASMRNTMADLTDKGLLEQPHTSAGRIPSALAFQHYLESVLVPKSLGSGERTDIRLSLDQAGTELSSLLRRSSRVLSTHAGQVGIVLAPDNEDVRWKSIDFVPVRPHTVMAILVLDGGVIQNRILSVVDDLSRDELTTFSNYLNHHYAGRSLTEVRALILAELSGAKHRLSKLYTRALVMARDIFDGEEQRDVYYDGTSKLLNQPEFSDVQAMRKLLRLFDDRTRLLELLERTIEANGTLATVATAKDNDDSQGYGLVISPYGPPGPRGAIGVIGPLRMDYAKVVPIVDFTAKMLTQVIQNKF